MPCTPREQLTDNSPDGSLELQRHPVGRDETEDGDEDDEGGAKPVDVLVPVLPGHRQL